MSTAPRQSCGPTPQPKKKPIPGWVVGVATLVTGAITAVAMSRGGFKPAWANDRPYSISGVPKFVQWAVPGWNPQLQALPINAGSIVPVATNGGALVASPVATAGATPAAFAPGAPTLAAAPIIRAGSVSLHTDRGTCTGCHSVISAMGAPIPAISATSLMIHEYRGVCTNCHLIAVGPSSPGVARAAAAMAPVSPPPARPKLEGEWMGAEVAPITQLTRTQFGLAAGTQGVVVVEAEAQAATAGLKPGDVVMAVNLIPVRTMAEFLGATQNGTLGSGSVDVLRGSQRFAVVLGGAAANALPVMPKAAPVPPAFGNMP